MGDRVLYLIDRHRYASVRRGLLDGTHGSRADDGTRGVVGRVDDDQAGAVVDEVDDLPRIQPEAVVADQPIGTRLLVEDLRQRTEAGVSGIREHNVAAHGGARRCANPGHGHGCGRFAVGAGASGRRQPLRGGGRRGHGEVCRSQAAAGKSRLELESGGVVVGTADVRVLPGWVSIIPPLLAIAVALVSKQVIPALFLGVWFGATALIGFTPAGAFRGLLDTYAVHVFGAVVNPSQAQVLLFSFMIGGMIGIVIKNVACRAWSTRSRGLRPIGAAGC